MIIEMKKGLNLGALGFVVKSLQDSGCDVLIKRNNGSFVIAALGSAAGKLDFVFMERLVGIKRYDRSNAFFVSCNGEGFEEAWSVLRLLENRQ